MTYEEYKNHLKVLGPLDDVSKGLLSAFELGYAQGLSEKVLPYALVVAEEERKQNK